MTSEVMHFAFEAAQPMPGLTLDVQVQRATSQESWWRHWKLPSTHKLLSHHGPLRELWQHWRHM